MVPTAPARASALFLLALGFLTGVVATVGCGGSSGSDAFAAGGSTTVVHAKSLDTPTSFMNDFTFSASFTPSDPNAVVLAVQVIGEIETGMTNVEITTQSRLSVQAESLGPTLIATVNATAPINVTAPYALTAGIPPTGTYEIEVFLNATTDGAPVQINALTIRLITTEGVMLMDPSSSLL